MAYLFKIFLGITNIMTAITEVSIACPHEASNKCLNSANQIISRIIATASQAKKYPNTLPIITPNTTIHTVSVNFALLPPTIALPASHKKGEIIMMFSIRCKEGCLN
ncbi:MAG: hypothetical protein ABSB40_12280 [Nitrososphaeria archaeon]|jgi:hypothetical protein